MSYVQITGLPVPVFRFNAGIIPSEEQPPIADALKGMEVPVLYRGVTIDRYPTIATTGVDVEPSDAPIFCAPALSKALEYIQWPQGVRAGAIMAFRADHLERSFVALDEIGETVTAPEDYPHLHEDSTRRWYSRVAQSPVFGYEEAYGYWIPGDPWEALIAVFLVGEVGLPWDWSPPGERSKSWTPPADWALATTK